jgi:eukaryotic-like serine/threonine-protein kinase
MQYPRCSLTFAIMMIMATTWASTAPQEKPVSGQTTPSFAIVPFSADQARAHQDKWAAHLKQKVEIENSLGMKFRLIPPGEFFMGSPATEDKRFPDEHQHRVRLTKPFYLGVYEVTQAQYEKVIGTNPAQFKGAKRPLDNVSWEDAQAFLRKLNSLEQGTGRVYRLPTEAEWEFACRAGTATPFHFGDSLDSTQANFNGDHPYGQGKKGPSRYGTVPVGTFPANAFGLHDMHGNVCEWCQDGYDANFNIKENGTAVDPVNEQANKYRVLRGSSWFFWGHDLRSACRDRGAPDEHRNEFGFRVALSITVKAR